MGATLTRRSIDRRISSTERTVSSASFICAEFIERLRRQGTILHLPPRCSISYYMATITLRVPDDMDWALQRQSAALGISKSDLAREALKRYLRVMEFRSLRTKLAPRAQASGINTDEDVFEVLEKK